MARFGNIRYFIYGFVASVIFFIFVLSAFFRVSTAFRPPAPPERMKMPHPWGAMDSDENQNDEDSDLEISITESLFDEDGQFDLDNDGVRDYEILALSGGGANGAFGAGIICGWSDTNKRPDFKIVSGVSTGALQAAVAFLGPEYDYILEKLYTQYETDQIYKKRLPLLSLSGDSIYNSQPLKKRIEEYVDEKMLVDVASKYRSGYRLYIGTTNFDTQEFVIWDMGKIASSKRKGNLQLYRNVLLASASIPVLFPPVYFEIENKGQKYYEMHYDGGSYGNILFSTVLVDFIEALQGVGLKKSEFNIELYIIDNGKSLLKPERKEVKPRIDSIAEVTINNLLNISVNQGLYRIFVLSNRYGIDFNFATIGENAGLSMDSMDFNKKAMQRLYNQSYEITKKGYDWLKVPPGIDPNDVN